MFTTTPTNFITQAQEDAYVKGVSVNYIAANGTNYSTMEGSQTGSLITYSSSVSGTEGGLKIQTLVGTVNCKLYNENNPTDVINLTNGSFKLVFKEFD